MFTSIMLILITLKLLNLIVTSWLLICFLPVLDILLGSIIVALIIITKEN